MSLSLDVMTLGVPDVADAHTFYSAALSPISSDYGGFVDLDLHGKGHVGLSELGALAEEAATEPDGSGFPGFLFTYVVDQPREAKGVEAAAKDAGGAVVRPAKKGLFSGFTGVFQAPDGSRWEIAAENKKDTTDAESPPRPTQAGVTLGVGDTKAARDFYLALGMAVQHDYGNTYVSFEAEPGAGRLALMPRTAVAKEAGAEPAGEGFRGIVLHRRAESRSEVDSLLEAAAAAGGTITVPASEADWGGYSGHFADLDGFLWNVGTAS